MLEIEQPEVDILQIPDGDDPIPEGVDADYNLSYQTWQQYDGRDSVQSHIRIRSASSAPDLPSTLSYVHTKSSSSTALSDSTALQNYHGGTVISLDPDSQTWPDPKEVKVEVTVPTEKVGLVIGRRGRTIKAMQEKTQTRMQIIQEPMSQDGVLNDSNTKTLVITGRSESVSEAHRLIFDLISRAPPFTPYQLIPPPCQDDLEAGPQTPNSGNTMPLQYPRFYPYSRPNTGRVKTTRFPVPRIAVGLIIGKGGDTINRIRRDTGAKVQFSPITDGGGEEQMATVIGRSDQIRHACTLIDELVDTATHTFCSNQGREGCSQLGDCDEPSSYNEQEYCEDRIYIPRKKAYLLLSKNRKGLGNISEASGALCEPENSSSSADTARGTIGVLVKGTRSQILRAKELIREMINGQAKGSSDPRVTLNHTVNAGSFGKQECGQGDQGSHWDSSWEDEPNHFQRVPIMEQNNYYANVPAQVCSNYANWVHYIPIPGMPPPPLYLNQEQTPRFIPPIPIVSATIVQSPDESPPHSNLPPELHSSVSNFPPPDTAQMDSKLTQAGGEIPSCTDANASKDYQDEVQLRTDELHAPAKETVDDIDGAETLLTTQEEQQQQRLSWSSSGLNQGGVLPNQSQPQFGYPPNLGSPDSCTRIVSFYYDLNANSVFITNQWHFY